MMPNLREQLLEHGNVLRFVEGSESKNSIVGLVEKEIGSGLVVLVPHKQARIDFF